MQEIYKQGGRYFWIHNTGPLGCLPYVLDGLSLDATQVDQTGCAIPINELAQYFNFGLKKVVVHLREHMPLAAITYVDVYSIKYNLISQANKYGTSILYLQMLSILGIDTRLMFLRSNMSVYLIMYCI